MGAVALDALRVGDRDDPYLPCARGAGGKYRVEVAFRELTSVFPIPTRGVAQQKIDTCPGPRRLLRECIGHIGQFAVGRGDRVAMRAPDVIGGGSGKGEENEHAKQYHAKTQTPEARDARRKRFGVR